MILAHHRVPPAPPRPPHVEQRIREIERALMSDPDRERRRELTREYLNLTEPMELDI